MGHSTLHDFMVDTFILEKVPQKKMLTILSTIPQKGTQKALTMAGHQTSTSRTSKLFLQHSYINKSKSIKESWKNTYLVPNS
jgi:hypothetical protein